jgi:hypothetical protein
MKTNMNKFFYIHDEYDGRRSECVQSPCTRDEPEFQRIDRRRIEEKADDPQPERRGIDGSFNSTEKLIVIVVLIELLIHYLMR